MKLNKIIKHVDFISMAWKEGLKLEVMVVDKGRGESEWMNKHSLDTVIEVDVWTLNDVEHFENLTKEEIIEAGYAISVGDEATEDKVMFYFKEINFEDQTFYDPDYGKLQAVGVV